LAAKLAGHSNPAITLSYYTYAVGGAEEAVEALTRAFQTPEANNIASSAAT
jgi:hypothetical protein